MPRSLLARPPNSTDNGSRGLSARRSPIPLIAGSYSSTRGTNGPKGITSSLASAGAAHTWKRPGRPSWRARDRSVDACCSRGSPPLVNQPRSKDPSLPFNTGNPAIEPWTFPDVGNDSPSFGSLGTTADKEPQFASNLRHNDAFREIGSHALPGQGAQPCPFPRVRGQVSDRPSHGPRVELGDNHTRVSHLLWSAAPAREADDGLPEPHVLEHNPRARVLPGRHREDVEPSEMFKRSRGGRNQLHRIVQTEQMDFASKLDPIVAFGRANPYKTGGRTDQPPNLCGRQQPERCPLVPCHRSGTANHQGIVLRPSRLTDVHLVETPLRDKLMNDRNAILIDATIVHHCVYDGVRD